MAVAGLGWLLLQMESQQHGEAVDATSPLGELPQLLRSGRPGGRWRQNRASRCQQIHEFFSLLMH